MQDRVMLGRCVPSRAASLYYAAVLCHTLSHAVKSHRYVKRDGIERSTAAKLHCPYQVTREAATPLKAVPLFSCAGIEG